MTLSICTSTILNKKKNCKCNLISGMGKVVHNKIENCATIKKENGRNLLHLCISYGLLYCDSPTSGFPTLQWAQCVTKSLQVILQTQCAGATQKTAMNVIEEIKRINEIELSKGITNTNASWHCKYANSAWIYIGNIPHNLTEGNVFFFYL
jgi:hypothetical protein